MLPEGLKKTKGRLLVMEVLKDSNIPISAQAIFEKLNEEVWLSTIYRTLEVLVEYNVVHKIQLTNTEKAMYELTRTQHRHFAHCLECHKIIEVHNCPMPLYKPEIADASFQVVGHSMEIMGYCSNCSV